MCIVKTPKLQTQAAVDNTAELPILRNPLLDGQDPATKALRIGRNALRIERTPAGGTAQTVTPAGAVAPEPGLTSMVAPTLPQNPLAITRGGGGGGSSRDFYSNAF